MITSLFWDVGGVLLTNGWDHVARGHAVQRFGLDAEAFARRHEAAVDAFECGRLSLDEYLHRTVFHEPRSFSVQEFRAFMFAQSQPHGEALAFAHQLAATGRYRMATLNNESLDLNLHRIRRFELDRTFTLFCSSCFLGVAKPDPAIWQKALQLTQRRPEECLFVDDREENVAAAQSVGWNAVRYQGVEALRTVLAAAGDP